MPHGFFWKKGLLLSYWFIKLFVICFRLMKILRGYPRLKLYFFQSEILLIRFYLLVNSQ